MYTYSRIQIDTKETMKAYTASAATAFYYLYLQSTFMIYVCRLIHCSSIFS